MSSTIRHLLLIYTYFLKTHSTPTMSISVDSPFTARSKYEIHFHKNESTLIAPTQKDAGSIKPDIQKSQAVLRYTQNFTGYQKAQ